MNGKSTLCAALIALTLVGGCDNELQIYENVEVPVALVFPSEEMRDRVEADLIERLDTANTIFANSGVTLVIEEIRVEDYDPNFDARFDIEEAMLRAEPGGPLNLYIAETIIDVDGDEDLGGYAINHDCNKVTFLLDSTIANEASWVVAHEIGHQLGLEHLDEEGNFMHPDMLRGGEDILSDQEENFLYGANRYKQVCMGLER